MQIHCLLKGDFKLSMKKSSYTDGTPIILSTPFNVDIIMVFI